MLSEVGGGLSTQREPTQTGGEHANPTRSDPPMKCFFTLLITISQFYDAKNPTHIETHTHLGTDTLFTSWPRVGAYIKLTVMNE